MEILVDVDADADAVCDTGHLFNDVVVNPDILLMFLLSFRRGLLIVFNFISEIKTIMHTHIMTLLYIAAWLLPLR